MICTQAIVLNTRAYKEHDMLVSFYTKDFGKRTILARGTRKPLSKLAPFLHSRGVLRCGFVEGRTFPVLVDADMLLTSSCVEKVQALFEKTNSLCYEGQKDVRLWNLLVEALIEGKASEITEEQYEGWLTRLYRETYEPTQEGKPVI